MYAIRSYYAPGTEVGVTEPIPTFSTCFGAPFMPRRPEVYGKLLAAKIAEYGASCWLVNTGRITSYNVCYTKLLRPGIGESARVRQPALVIGNRLRLEHGFLGLHLLVQHRALFPPCVISSPDQMSSPKRSATSSYNFV